jgi:hypothetical protein
VGELLIGRIPLKIPWQNSNESVIGNGRDSGENVFDGLANSLEMF